MSQDLAGKKSGLLDWENNALLVFLSLIASAIIIFFASVQQFQFLKILQNFFGAYALAFPVGWLLTVWVFPERKEVSLLARGLLSVALSFAVHSISLLAVFYLTPVKLNLQLDIFLLLFFGAVFFAGILVRKRMVVHGKG